MRQRTTRLYPRLVVVAAGVLTALSACGGSGSHPAAGPSTSTSPSATAPTTSPNALAEAAALRASDLGAPWTQSQAAKGIHPVSSQGCAHEVGFDVSKVTAEYLGPVFRRGQASRYATDFSFVFDTEATATQFVTMFGTQAYRECRAKGLTEQVKKALKNVAGARYRIGIARTVDNAGVKRVQLSYQFQALVNGKIRDANGRTDDLLYQRGAVVDWVVAESAQGAGEAPAVLDQAFGEIDSAAAKALSRCCGAD